MCWGLGEKEKRKIKFLHESIIFYLFFTFSFKPKIFFKCRSYFHSLEDGDDKPVKYNGSLKSE